MFTVSKTFLLQILNTSLILQYNWEIWRLATAWPERAPVNRNGSNWQSWPPNRQSLIWLNSVFMRPRLQEFSVIFRQVFICVSRTTEGYCYLPRLPAMATWWPSWGCRQSRPANITSPSFHISCLDNWRNAFKFCWTVTEFLRLLSLQEPICQVKFPVL